MNFTLIFGHLKNDIFVLKMCYLGGGGHFIPASFAMAESRDGLGSITIDLANNAILKVEAIKFIDFGHFHVLVHWHIRG